MHSPANEWTVDVAGISVAVRAASASYAATAEGRLGVAPTSAPAEVEVVLGPDVPHPPTGVEPTELEGYRAWTVDDVCWIADDEPGDMAVRVGTDGVVVGGSIDDLDLEDRFDDLLQFGVAAAAVSPSRIMLHAAVISRGDAAMMLVGASGSGKSTLAGAALVGGWDLMGDDLCVYRPDEGSVAAVVRTPFVPGEIADRHGLEGVREPGSRDRVQLPLDVLGEGRRRLIGIVSVGHGTEGAVIEGSSGDLGVFDDALPVPPFPYVLRRSLRAAGAFVDLPAVRLEHARDLDRRVPRAIELLDEAWRIFDDQ